MNPTMNLRWKVRPGSTQDAQPILQQWWEEVRDFGNFANEPAGEWRDVPTE